MSNEKDKDITSAKLKAEALASELQAARVKADELLARVSRASSKSADDDCSNHEPHLETGAEHEEPQTHSSDGNHEPPSMPPSGGNGGGMRGWWNGLDLWKKVGLMVLLAMCSSLTLSSMTMWNNERVTRSDGEVAVVAAKNAAKVAELEAKAASFKAQSAASMRIVNHSNSFTEIKSAITFDCSSSEVMMQNFASNSENLEEVEQGKIIQFKSGCAWSKFDYPVTTLQGEKYLIAFDNPYDDHKYFTCGRILPNKDTSGVCAEFINGHIGMKFRVIIQEGGYLKIGGKNV